MNIRPVAILAALVAALLMSACGQRGPLKLPDAPKAVLAKVAR